MYDIVFSYAFHHKKSEEGLEALINRDRPPRAILASPWRILKIARPYANEPTPPPRSRRVFELAFRNNIPILEADIRSEEAFDFIQRHSPARGVILGARIIPEKILRLFSVGIVNAHPGLLPHNRGLNTLEYAVLRNLPQAVSLHYVNAKVDAGQLISRTILGLDGLSDVMEVRALSLETQVRLLAELTFESEDQRTFELDGGFVNPPLSEASLSLFRTKWEGYVINYRAIREEFELTNT